MAQQLINIGASPNDGTGTPLRTSFDYTNQNFTELYAGGGVGTSTNTQVIFNDSGVLKGDAGLVYNKTTDALTVAGALTSTTGDISASNGRLNTSGASAGLRITSSTGDMYQTVASRTTAVDVTSVTVVFTVSTVNASTVIVDVQLAGFGVFCDFCLGKYASTTTQILRTNASSGITGALTVDGTGAIYTMTIGSIPSVSLLALALKVCVGGGLGGSATFSALPVVTFLP